MVSNFYQNTPVIRFTSNEYRIVSVLVSFINSYFWYQDYIIPEVQKFVWLDLCDPLHFQHNHLRQLGDPFNTNTNCFFCLINHVKGFQSLLKTPVIRLTALGNWGILLRQTLICFLFNKPNKWFPIFTRIPLLLGLLPMNTELSLYCLL